jgi:5-formyltetrahydrofolate cyclo-ligase
MSPQTITQNPAQRQKLRNEVLASRDALSAQDRQHKSAQIIKTLVEHDIFRQARTIFTYVNFRSEVITNLLIDTCLLLDKRLCVPLTIQQDYRLVPYQLTDRSQLRSGYYGIPEPDPSTSLQIVPQEIDLTILPGSVFDRFGGRLGYGGGFYDRFIEREAPEAIRIGLAFDLQLANRLPLLPHDQTLHHLITEKQMFTFNKDMP